MLTFSSGKDTIIPFPHSTTLTYSYGLTEITCPALSNMIQTF